jgi:ATP-dependent DNA helicase RecQ
MIITILARTRMHGGRVCIGGMSDDGRSFRLMTATCDYHGGTCVYQVGEIWEMDLQPCPNLEAPHLEDVAVVAANRIGVRPNLRDFVLQRSEPWAGGINCIFDGRIRFTSGGSGYIAQSSGLPGISTGFWLPDTELRYIAQPRGAYSPQGDGRYLSYVGTVPPAATIVAGTLVRVSLAKWWRPQDADPSFELRCYAQLSGWL